MSVAAAVASGGDVTLQAGGKFTENALKDTANAFYEQKSSGLFLGTSGASVSIGFGKTTDTDTYLQASWPPSEIALTGGNLSITANGPVMISRQDGSLARRPGARHRLPVWRPLLHRLPDPVVATRILGRCVTSAQPAALWPSGRLPAPVHGAASLFVARAPSAAMQTDHHRQGLPTGPRPVRASCLILRTGLSWKIPATRARPLYSGSYPAAVKKLAHSSGVKVSRTDPAASHKVVTVLAALARKRALSLANAISIGLKSGL